MAVPQTPTPPRLMPARRSGRLPGALLTLLLAGLPACAQDAAGLSIECRVPNSQLYTVATLPGAKAALTDKHSLRILAVGGSAAPGASASYPVKLEAALEQALPHVDVVMEHRGLPGEIASGAAERLRSLVADADPDLVVWQVGTHDAIARVDPAAFTEALDDAVGWLKSHGIDVVLVDPLYTASVAADADYNRIVDGVRTVATKHGVPLVRRFEALRYLASRTEKGEGHILGRQFRLNDLGLRCMAEHVALTIASSLDQTPTSPSPETKPAAPPSAAPPSAASPSPAPASTGTPRNPG